MKIWTHVECIWDGTKYITDYTRSVGWEFAGLVAMCCGASAAQTQIGDQQAAAYTQMTQQAAQVFGDSSSVFGDLMKTFAPTIAAGPSQQGFSPGELSNLNSSAITQTGQNYKNAKYATGEAEAAQGGGNSADVSGGSKTGVDLGLATSAAAQTSGEENQIGEANYQTGRENYNAAVQGLAGAPNAFGASTNANNAATNSGNAAESTANDIAQENQSWVQAVTGALGTVAGAATGAGINKIGSSPKPPPGP